MWIKVVGTIAKVFDKAERHRLVAYDDEASWRAVGEGDGFALKVVDGSRVVEFYAWKCVALQACR